MHRIDSPTKSVDLFGSGKHGYTEGNPQTGVPPTQTTDDQLNTFQEELVAVVEAGGLTLDKTNNAQLLAAIRTIGSVGTMQVANWFDNDATASAGTPHLNGVCYDASLDMLVAVGDRDGTNSTIVFSTNGGATWTVSGTIPATNIELFDVACDGSGNFVAVGLATGAEPHVLTSPDGNVWTARLSATWSVAPVVAPGNFDLNSVAYDGSGRFLTVGNVNATGKPLVGYSDDNGATWKNVTAALPTPAGGGDLEGVSHNDTDGTWIAVGKLETGLDTMIVRSTDNGAVWTEIANPSAQNLLSVAYGSSAWIAVGVAAAGVDGILRSTDDGLTWTDITIDTATFFAVAYDSVESKFVMGGNATGDAKNIHSSADQGSTWVRRNLDTAGNDIHAVVYGGGNWTAVGQTTGAATMLVRTSLRR